MLRSDWMKTENDFCILRAYIWESEREKVFVRERIPMKRDYDHVGWLEYNVFSVYFTASKNQFIEKLKK